MIKVGITGQAGFIGMHLFNTLGLYPDKFERIPFENTFFKDEKSLQSFVHQCDVIIHLAAMNRHSDPGVLYKTNIGLIKQLIDASEKTDSKPRIIFSSSIQERKDNPYSRSKKEGRRLLEQWADRNNTQFTGLVIPNVYGPFGKPYYNSVVATFCHQLVHNETPKIDIDGELKLIYVGELVEQIIFVILQMESEDIKAEHSRIFEISHTTKISVSSLLMKLNGFKEIYFDKGIIPNIDERFDLNLFNTFRSYTDHSSFFPFRLKANTDERGLFVETMKLNSGGQVSFSTTAPGVTRGNHFHTRKAERFAVIRGKAIINIRRVGTDEVLSFELNGETPSFVDMPIWYTHNITNIGDDLLFTIFWINEHFDTEDPDTFFEVV